MAEPTIPNDKVKKNKKRQKKIQRTAELRLLSYLT